jgi:hypothetical protein
LRLEAKAKAKAKAKADPYGMTNKRTGNGNAKATMEAGRTVR